MTLLISVLAAVVVSVLVTLLLLNVRTPHYRAQRRQARQLLQWMLLGQASEHQWRIFCEIPIRHDPPLEAIRRCCADIDERCFVGDNRDGHLLNKDGMAALEQQLQELQALEEAEP
ncbi:hypothetical protein [Pseudomaricurvus sp. HS19]|uniref:hypothetical protein n=1 Tax=Pseudomaricurvus sp. HS19 TaxID=2692626 RepID=UPI00136C3928|nr:hypothetical protein [Pseudomaricurvus sp. HS19]MYM64964.1 hypothetical protein [Pseudomaricurvus sp. HS19]